MEMLSFTLVVVSLCFYGKMSAFSFSHSDGGALIYP